MNTTEKDFVGSIEEKPRADEAMKKAPETHPSPHERRRRFREELKTLKQDMKPIEEGGKYLDDVRYPEVRLFHFLWFRFEYESAAEIAAAYKAYMEQWNAYCAKDPTGRLYIPGLVMPQDMVEKCLHKLSLWSLLETKVENGVTKYRMDHDTVKANRKAPYVYKLLEELL